MEANGFTPVQGGPATEAPPAGDWRSEVPPGSRQRIVNRIFETCRRHFSPLSPMSVDEIMKITVRFEKVVYANSTSLTDYLRRVAVKLCVLEGNTPVPKPSLEDLLSQLQITGDS